MYNSVVPCVPKVCAYLTRNGCELLVFEGPGHDGLQVPKGTIEPGESPRDALEREVWEESGLTTLQNVEHLTSDVWTRRRTPPKRYHRQFFHAEVDTDRDTWTHEYREVWGSWRDDEQVVTESADRAENPNATVQRRVPPL
ncbi:NUDIX domain-containing protein [Natrinema pallidum]|uniref:NUDIX domain-containing protein n=1 Tax=Natrinema pallidum TaxID=69527 RepID=UPI00268EDB50